MRTTLPSPVIVAPGHAFDGFEIVPNGLDDDFFLRAQFVHHDPDPSIAQGGHHDVKPFALRVGWECQTPAPGESGAIRDLSDAAPRVH